MTSSSSSSLSRRQRERLRRREAMLRAAQTVFAEKGYASATLDEIAERAEFGKGTLYNYFEGGKEEILMAIFEDIYDERFDLIQETFTPEALEAKSLQEVFHAYVVRSFEFFEAREELFIIFLKELHRLAFGEDPERARYCREQQERMVDLLVRVLEQAAAAGDIKPLPARPVAHMLLENVNGILLHRAMLRQQEGEKESILFRPQKTAEFLTTVLFDGLQQRSASPEAENAPTTSAH